MLDDDDRNQMAPSESANATTEGRARTVRLADVVPGKVEWLWQGRIPRGALTILDGDPGLGKSTLMADIAARVTSGRPMPGDPASAVRNPEHVLLMQAEDDLGNTVQPRLHAAEADLDLIDVVTGIDQPEDPDAPPTLSVADIAQVELKIRLYETKLVIVDPFMNHLPAGIDPHKDSEIRKVLRALAASAQRTGAAVVIIRHLRKGEGSAMYRGAGSIGIIGAARSGLLVARDPSGGDRLYLASTKSNLARKPPTLGWRLVDAGDAARVDWGDIAPGVTADDLVSVAAASPDLSERAVTELERVLAAGPVPATQAQDAVVKATGCSPATVRRAKEQLKVHCAQVRGPDGQGNHWVWSLAARGDDDELDE